MSKYVNADAVLNKLNGYRMPTHENDTDFEKVNTHGYNTALEIAKSVISTEQTADVAPVVHAHWGREKCVAYQRKGCSRCGSVMPLKKNKKGYALIWYSNYCPNCGAKMDKEKKEND